MCLGKDQFCLGKTWFYPLRQLSKLAPSFCPAGGNEGATVQVRSGVQALANPTDKALRETEAARTLFHYRAQPLAMWVETVKKHLQSLVVGQGWDIHWWQDGAGREALQHPLIGDGYEPAQG